MKEKFTYKNTPDFLVGGHLISKLFYAETFFRYEHTGSTITVQVEKPGFYTRDGKLHEDVVYYDLGDALAPVLKTDAKKLLTKDKNISMNGGMPLGFGIVEI